MVPNRIGLATSYRSTEGRAIHRELLRKIGFVDGKHSKRRVVWNSDEGRALLLGGVPVASGGARAARGGARGARARGRRRASPRRHRRGGARRCRFPGSPTIRIDGRDVDPAGAASRPALNCRIYYLPDGRVSPIPSREQLEEALSMSTALAQTAPPFTLPGVDGSDHSLDDYARRDGPRPRPVLQPLPVRAGVGRPAERRRARLRRPRRARGGDLVERRREPPRGLVRGDAAPLRARRASPSTTCTTRARTSRARSAPSGRPRCSSTTATAGSPTTARSTTAGTRRRSRRSYLRDALDAVLAGEAPGRRRHGAGRLHREVAELSRGDLGRDPVATRRSRVRGAADRRRRPRPDPGGG